MRLDRITVSSRSLFVLSLLCLQGVVSSSGFAKSWIVKFKNHRGFISHHNMIQSQYPLDVVDQHQSGKLALVEAYSGFVDDKVIQRLQKDDTVEYVVENIKMYALDMPDDPRYEEQWALKMVGAEKQWEINSSSEDIVVAVIDTGIDYNHEDLAGNIWTNPGELLNGKDEDGNGFVDDIHGWDFRDNNADPMDETSSKNPGHGTHCAGIIGAVGNNGVGVSGITQKVKIMPIRFLGADGSGDLFSAAKAIDYAVQNKAHVISASWGAPSQRAQVKPILEAIERAGEKGIVFVAAAANNGDSNDRVEMYPANAGYSHVISVAASDPDDGKPQWSNYGVSSVDIAAPGKDILSTLPSNTYGKLSGTSMATPLVAGEAAQLIAQAKVQGVHLTPTEVKALLQASGKKVDIETACRCRMDAGAAMTRLAQTTPTVTPYNLTLQVGATETFSAFGMKGDLVFAVNDPDVASVDASGKVKGLKEGTFKVIVKDQDGVTTESDELFVARAAPSTGACPFDDPLLCQVMCQIEKGFPWCD
ncbi:MAG: S8 family serine peptidase [Zetaproteobacteria bacterium]|nr:S8 family serine peptidase [Zetaproteobacteria bacterium]